jgi:hypothetical protein
MLDGAISSTPKGTNQRRRWWLAGGQLKLIYSEKQKLFVLLIAIHYTARFWGFQDSNTENKNIQFRFQVRFNRRSPCRPAACAYTWKHIRIKVGFNAYHLSSSAFSLRRS